MARRPRICLPGLPLHVIQRGNNKQDCFTCDTDFANYAHWLNDGSVQFGIRIHAWVFMTNHVHLLVTPLEADSLSRLFQLLGRRYVRYFNYNYSRTGSLFESRYRSCPIQDALYLLNCMRYIELNPVRAGMVSDPSEYAWSSYQSHAFGRKTQMWSPHELYIAMGSDKKARESAYRALISQVMEGSLISRIRHCANTGIVLGSADFRARIEMAAGQVPSSG